MSGADELAEFQRANDAPHFNTYPLVSYESGLSSPADVLSIWRSEFDACYEEGMLFHPVMHPQMIGRPHRIKVLERLVQHVNGHSNVRFARPEDAARHWRDVLPADERDVRSVRPRRAPTPSPDRAKL